MRNRSRLFNLVSGVPRFEVLNQAGTAQVYLYDEISWFGITAADFVAEFASLSGQDVDLHVNSPGGDVYEGLAMLNTIRAHTGRVTAYVDGVAASAASFLIMGAAEVVMAPNSELMIHDAWGLCLGNSADMRDTADRLDKVSDNIADIYARKSGGTAEQWREHMRAELWMSHDEAVTYGLADRVGSATSDSTEPLAYDLAKLRNHKPSATAVEPSFEWATPAELLGAFEEAAL